MNQTVPLADIPDEKLKSVISNKLQHLQSWEQEVPAVLIVHEYPSFHVMYMSKRGLDILGVTLDEIRLPSAEYHARFFNTDDVPNYLPKIQGLIERNNSDELITFFQQVRRSPDHEWTWYMSATRIFMRDMQNKPMLTLTMAVPVDAQSHITPKVERLMHENNFLRNNQHIFALLTKREKEILRLMALGDSSADISVKLHISEATALTHRRNIKSKLNAHSNYDITHFAQAFNLI